jgi:multiple sugar transport system permease protein
MIFSIYWSFQRWSLQISPDPLGFVGISNYVKVLADPLFKDSLLFTIRFSLIVLFLEMLFGLGIAIILNKELRGQSLIRSIIIMPVAIAPAVAGMLFRYMYYTEYGIIPYLLSIVGIGIPQEGILGNSTTAFWGLAVTDIWEWTPFIALVLLAGLQSIPREIIESAKIDGASEYKIFRFITFPLIKPVLTTVALFRFMQAFNVFDTIYVETGGGPGTSTHSLGYYLFYRGLVYYDIGFACAITWIISIIALVIINIYFRILSRGK